MELISNSDTLKIVQNEQNIDYNEPLGIQLEKFADEDEFFSPNNPPWNSLHAVAMWLTSIFLIALIPTIAIGIYVFSASSTPLDGAAITGIIQNDPNAVLANIFGVIPAHIATLFVAWMIVTYGRKHSFRKMLGWESGGFGILSLVAIIIGFFVVAGLFSNFFPEQENDLIRILKSSRTAVYLVAFMATFTAPLVEEVVYRGIMYSAFQRTFGVPLAVVLVTLLFSLVHVPQYYPSYATITVICLLSLVLTMVRVKSKNLLPCVILHTIFNGIQSIVMIAEPYIQTTKPQTDPAFFWLF